ncbi:MAG: accessory gene regulator B family protein [Oscillospiraceae bacterium]|nr:accessory gene regulator B family protein [Oscillospiraceae bacterium]
MIQSIARMYSLALFERNLISEDDREIHEYGLTALLMNLINYGLWLLLGIASSTLPETVFFLISYTVLRNIIGGWHASTPSKCTFCGILMWFVVIYVYKQLVLSRQLFVWLMVSIFLCLLAIVIKKDLSFERKASGIICLSCLCVLSFIFENASLYSYSTLIVLSLLCNIIMNMLLLFEAKRGTNE